MSRLVDLRQELEFRRCSEDLEFFLETYWHIELAGGEAVVIELRDRQREILGLWAGDGERDSISLKARQIGWSTLAAAVGFWNAFFHQRPIIFLSKEQRASRDLLAKSVFGYDRLPEWLKSRNSRSNRSVDSMKFKHGGRIESLPSKSDPARGKTAFQIYLDEWAFFENPENAWASVAPVAERGGHIHAISTANGAGTVFHKEYLKAKRGESKFKSMFFSWDAIPERDQAWYDGQARSMEEWQLHQEYPTDDHEAFIRSGNPAFDISKLQLMVTRKPTQSRVQGDELYGYQALPDKSGCLGMFKWPEDGHKYVIGADVAEGLKHGDFSSAHVICANTQEVVGVVHGKLDPDLFAEQLFRVGKFYNNALLGVERNASGLTVLTELRKHLRYGNLYYHRALGQRVDKRSTNLGWPTTVSTKPVMVDGVASVVRDDTLRINCADTIQELKEYKQVMSRLSSHVGWEGSPFDDRVMSLAVAVQMLQWVKVSEVAEAEAGEQWGSWAFWENQLAKSDEPGGWKVGNGRV